ncbi:MAG: sigma 54-interacting transcriptional regulator [Ignavibacteriales bacterium]|nr:sigma 54-interacting transcriptional regulator [Ignavibacteriales bacterium]
MQPKFLTFLETKRFRQIGSTKEINVNVRIISATNKDLKKSILEKNLGKIYFIE